jgi:hypothetical protein
MRGSDDSLTSPPKSKDRIKVSANVGYVPCDKILRTTLQ